MPSVDNDNQPIEEESDPSIGGNWHAGGYRSPFPPSIEEEVETRDRAMSTAGEEGIDALVHLCTTRVA